MYKISYIIHTGTDGQAAVFLNNNILLETVYSSGNGNKLNCGQAVITIPANTVLNLRSTTSGNVVIFVNGGGTQTAVNVSLIIERFA
jgi:hypothetical protein